MLQQVFVSTDVHLARLLPWTPGRFNPVLSPFLPERLGLLRHVRIPRHAGYVADRSSHPCRRSVQDCFLHQLGKAVSKRVFGMEHACLTQLVFTSLFLLIVVFIEVMQSTTSLYAVVDDEVGPGVCKMFAPINHLLSHLNGYLGCHKFQMMSMQ